MNLEVSSTTLDVTIEADPIGLEAVFEPITIEVIEDGIVTEFHSTSIDLAVEATSIGSIVTSPEITIVTAAEQGPPGVAGDAQTVILGTYECGANIASSSLVHLSPIDGMLYPADFEDELGASGFTISGAVAGQSIEVRRLGVLNGLSGLTRGQPRWLGTNGQTRATIPMSGIIQYVGLASETDTIFVELEEPEHVEV